MLVEMPQYKGDVQTRMHCTTATWSVAGVLPDGRVFELTIDPGFLFDGASIPRFLWRVCGHPMEVPRVAAALAHDWLYKAHVCPRKVADQVYRVISAYVEISAICYQVEYGTLRMLGGFAWRAHGLDDQISARAHGVFVLEGTVQKGEP